MTQTPGRQIEQLQSDAPTHTSHRQTSSSLRRLNLDHPMALMVLPYRSPDLHLRTALPHHLHSSPHHDPLHAAPPKSAFAQHLPGLVLPVEPEQLP
jgi:hypothetical protein